MDPKQWPEDDSSMLIGDETIVRALFMQEVQVFAKTVGQH